MCSRASIHAHTHTISTPEHWAPTFCGQFHSVRTEQELLDMLPTVHHRSLVLFKALLKCCKWFSAITTNFLYNGAATQKTGRLHLLQELCFECWEPRITQGHILMGLAWAVQPYHPCFCCERHHKDPPAQVVSHYQCQPTAKFHHPEVAMPCR